MNNIHMATRPPQMSFTPKLSKSTNVEPPPGVPAEHMNDSDFTDPPKKKPSSTRVLIYIVIGLVIFILIVLIGWLVYKNIKKPVRPFDQLRQPPLQPTQPAQPAQPTVGAQSAAQPQTQTTAQPPRVDVHQQGAQNLVNDKETRESILKQLDTIIATGAPDKKTLVPELPASVIPPPPAATEEPAKHETVSRVMEPLVPTKTASVEAETGVESHVVDDESDIFDT